MESSSIKMTYIRAGTYANTALTLTSADNGETWSYYPPDGFDSAILDGGATGPNTGSNVFTILGGSNITINGLTIQNFQQWGVGLHGGAEDSLAGFPNATVTASNNIIENNIFDNGYPTNDSGWAGGCVYAENQVENTTVSHNVCTNQYGQGFHFGADGDGGQGWLRFLRQISVRDKWICRGG